MKFSNEMFKSETVGLDDNVYVGCTFMQAKLLYLGGPIPHFDGCTFDGGSFMFEKGAGNAIEFLRELYHAGLHQNVEMLFDDIRRNPPGGAA